MFWYYILWENILLELDIIHELIIIAEYILYVQYNYLTHDIYINIEIKRFDEYVKCYIYENKDLLENKYLNR